MCVYDSTHVEDKGQSKALGLYNTYINIWAYKTYTSMNFPCHVIGKWRSLYDKQRRETPLTLRSYGNLEDTDYVVCHRECQASWAIGFRKTFHVSPICESTGNMYPTLCVFGWIQTQVPALSASPTSWLAQLGFLTESKSSSSGVAVPTGSGVGMGAGLPYQPPIKKRHHNLVQRST